MLDSKGDNQGGGYNAPSNAPMDNSSQPQGGYNAPQQQTQQSYQKPVQQQQSYQQQPQQPSYNNNSQAQNQSRQMPSSNDIPTIDIDEDEIPF